MSLWNDAQKFEEQFWGNCINTFSEELKQRVYAEAMGLDLIRVSPLGFGYDLQGKRILDIGGGPASLLLKCINCTGVIVDPVRYPDWVHLRYASMNLWVRRMMGEDIGNTLGQFDEVWIYNVLQHTENPEKILANAKAIAPALRIFEWIDISSYEGHPQTLTKDNLEAWIGQPGKISEYTGQNECYGRAFYGHFLHARNHS